MGAREQFARWGFCDHTAVCLHCGTHHLIAKSEQISAQPWLDWLAKHAGHCTFILPHSELGKLGEQVAHAQSSNADVKTAYAATSAYTLTATGLASDANLLAGREATGVSNASNKYPDVLFSALITVGTSPTDARQIELHAVAALDDTPTYPDVFDGTDSAETITSAQIKAGICRQLAILPTNNTSDRSYPATPIGLAQLYGQLPPVHTVFLVHNTGVNLNVTAANHFAKHTPVYSTVI